MYISIDTSTMRQIAVLALNLKDEIDITNAIVNCITEHNDWNCPERDLINDSMQQIKKGNFVLAQDADSFSSTVNKIADKFDELDSSLSKSYNSFDLSVGKLLRLEGTNVDITRNTGFQKPTGYIQKLFHQKSEAELFDSPEIKNNNFSKIEVTGMDEPINVANFADVKNMLTGQEFNHIDINNLYNKYFG